MGVTDRALHLEDLPALLDEQVGRIIYVDRIGLDATVDLTARGYQVVDLFSLPRQTSDQERAYLDAKRQAIEEGTILVNQHIIRALELGMRAAGMMGKERHTKVTLEGDSESIDELLNWSCDRHTLENNSTLVNAQRKP